jgi:predicted O-methyltransferase YrrM
MIQYVKENISGELTGVELGVERGFNSLNILQTLSIKTLYCVDPYSEYLQGESTVSQHKNKKYFDCAMDILWNYINRGQVKFILETSSSAIKDIPNGLDFVYIDANHSYANVKEDITLYYPKLKQGGVIGGDDYWAYYPGVARAVNEFVDKHKLKLYGVEREWWVVKK